MMNEPEKSDPSTVAAKPANKTGRSDAELVESRCSFDRYVAYLFDRYLAQYEYEGRLDGVVNATEIRV